MRKKEIQGDKKASGKKCDGKERQSLAMIKTKSGKMKSIECCRSMARRGLQLKK